jgi:hypothetical protein
MDYIVEWKVMSRSVNEVRDLFARSAFQQAGSSPRFEENGIVFVMECQKN